MIQYGQNKKKYKEIYQYICRIIYSFFLFVLVYFYYDLLRFSPHFKNTTIYIL